jgi:PAS domain-containing protein
MERILRRHEVDGHGSVGSAARAVGAWAGVAALTALVCLAVWRLSLALDSPLILCAAFALPAALTLRSLSGAFVSFCATAVVGVILMQAQGAGSRLAFILVGLTFAAAVMYVTVTGAGKLAEARRALGIIRRRSETGVAAIQRAGVCMVVVAKNQTWLTVNEAAWNAFGSDARLRRGMDARFELDDEAATALMHSGSRESWRKLHESVIADGAHDKLKPGEALAPYRVTLYDIAGRKTRYRFTVSLGYQGELAFVGFPESAQDLESEDEQKPGAWFRAVVNSICEPSVVVQSDGAILASNGAFQVLCGRGAQARYIFDCPNVHGASERTLLASVWLPTQTGATDLPAVFMEGAGQAVAARIAPPKAAYTEAVLIVFKEVNQPVPDGFVEHTRPMDL